METNQVAIKVNDNQVNFVRENFPILGDQLKDGKPIEQKDLDQTLVERCGYNLQESANFLLDLRVKFSSQTLGYAVRCAACNSDASELIRKIFKKNVPVSSEDLQKALKNVQGHLDSVEKEFKKRDCVGEKRELHLSAREGWNEVRRLLESKI